MLTSRRKETEF